MGQACASKAEVRLLTVANAKPAGARYVDFVLLTTAPTTNTRASSPCRGHSFAYEALAANRLYIVRNGASCAQDRQKGRTPQRATARRPRRFQHNSPAGAWRE